MVSLDKSQLSAQQTMVLIRNKCAALLQIQAPLLTIKQITSCVSETTGYQFYSGFFYNLSAPSHDKQAKIGRERGRVIARFLSITTSRLPISNASFTGSKLRKSIPTAFKDSPMGFFLTQLPTARLKVD